MRVRVFINIIILVIIGTSLSFGGYFYYKYSKLERASTISQKNIKDLISKVGDLYLIPEGEEPTIATVSDPNALRSQLFFISSQKGDKVLIFSKAGKAVLYRPSINKIIEVTPINKNDQTNQLPTTTPGTL